MSLTEKDLTFAKKFVGYVVPDADTIDRSPAVIVLEQTLQAKQAELYEFILWVIDLYRDLLRTRAVKAQAD